MTLEYPVRISWVSPASRLCSQCMDTASRRQVDGLLGDGGQWGAASWMCAALGAVQEEARRVRGIISMPPNRGASSVSTVCVGMRGSHSVVLGMEHRAWISLGQRGNRQASLTAWLHPLS